MLFIGYLLLYFTNKKYEYEYVLNEKIYHIIKSIY